jgi:hypothetical protein
MNNENRLQIGKYRHKTDHLIGYKPINQQFFMNMSSAVVHIYSYQFVEFFQVSTNATDVCCVIWWLAKQAIRRLVLLGDHSHYNVSGTVSFHFGIHLVILDLARLGRVILHPEVEIPILNNLIVVFLL